MFHSLTDKEQVETLQCLLKNIIVYPDKLVLNVFEIPEFISGSQKRSTSLPW